MLPAWAVTAVGVLAWFAALAVVGLVCVIGASASGASFVGSPRMNLLPVHPGANGNLVVEGYETPLPLSGRVRHAYNRATLRELVLGARPEDVVLSATPGPEMLQATVYASEPLGDRTIYDLRIGTQLMKVKASAHLFVNICDPMWFRIDMDRAHLFDATSGERIECRAKPCSCQA